MWLWGVDGIYLGLRDELLLYLFSTLGKLGGLGCARGLGTCGYDVCEVVYRNNVFVLVLLVLGFFSWRCAVCG